MRNRFDTMRLAWLLFALVIPGPIARGKVTGDLSLLDAVAKANRENWDKVHTWTGTVEVKDVRTDANGARHEWTSKASFALRKKPYALKWQQAIVPADLEKSPAIYMNNNGLIKGDKMYRLSISKPKDGKPSQRNAEVGPVKVIGAFSDNFDPMQFTEYRNENLAERFAFFSEHAKSLGPPDWTVERKGDVVSMSMQEGKGSTKYLVNLKEGGNMEQYDATGSNGAYEKWTFDFQKRGDVWLPKIVTAEQVDQYKRFWSRRVRWIDSSIDIQPKDSDFTPSAIGMTAEEEKQAAERQ
jgi:hypothetical protein